MWSVAYGGVKLLDRVLKVFKQVIIDVRIRRKVNIDGIQFWFSPGKGTTDSIMNVDSKMA